MPELAYHAAALCQTFPRLLLADKLCSARGEAAWRQMRRGAV